jgi:enoyl-CoA hydratase
MTDLVLSENRAAVCILTLNRPSALNAVSPELVQALTGAVVAAQGDSSVNAIVLTAAGRAFSAGADLKSPHRGPMTSANRATKLAHSDAMIRLSDLLSGSSKPTVAAVQGYALGGGALIALACDMVIAGEGAVFGYPEVKLGMAGALVTGQIAHLVGPKIAFELAMLCENMRADRAMAIGLVNRVVPDARLLDEAVAIATTLAAFDPETVRMTKSVLRRATNLQPRQALELARDTSLLMSKLA